MKKQGIVLAAAASTLLLSGCASWRHSDTSAPAQTTAQQSAPAPATPTQQAILVKDHSSCKGRTQSSGAYQGGS